MWTVFVYECMCTAVAKPKPLCSNMLCARVPQCFYESQSANTHTDWSICFSRGIHCNSLLWRKKRIIWSFSGSFVIGKIRRCRFSFVFVGREKTLFTWVLFPMYAEFRWSDGWSWSKVIRAVCMCCVGRRRRVCAGAIVWLCGYFIFLIRICIATAQPENSHDKWQGLHYSWMSAKWEKKKHSQSGNVLWIRYARHNWNNNANDCSF